MITLLLGGINKYGDITFLMNSSTRNPTTLDHSSSEYGLKIAASREAGTDC